jgi:uncharacterized pyridoxamine 5'-phosphate oxidase family protein
MHTIDLTPYVSNDTHNKAIFQKIKEDKKLRATLPTFYGNKACVSVKIVACLPNCVKVKKSKIQILEMLRNIYKIPQEAVDAFSMTYEDITNAQGYFIKFSIKEHKQFAEEV